MPLPRSAGLQDAGTPSPCRLCHSAHSREAELRGNRRPQEGLAGASCHARSVLCKHGSGSREGNGCKGGKGKEGAGRRRGKGPWGRLLRAGLGSRGTAR